MRIKLIITFFVSTLFACNCDKQCSETEELNKIKIQLEATEAQLLNVKAELSKCKSENPATIESDNP